MITNALVTITNSSLSREAVAKESTVPEMLYDL